MRPLLVLVLWCAAVAASLEQCRSKVANLVFARAGSVVGPILELLVLFCVCAVMYLWVTGLTG